MTVCKICGEKSLAYGLCRKHYDQKFRKIRYQKSKTKAIQYSKLRNELRKNTLARELSPNLKCQSCGAPLDLKKKRGVFFINNEKKVVCENCWHENRKIETFSRQYKKCRWCGSTKDHSALGLCSKCYSKYIRDSKKK